MKSFIDLLDRLLARERESMKNVQSKRDQIDLFLSTLTFTRTKPVDRCLSEQDIASFIDQGSNHHDYERLARHMARCDRCRQLFIRTRIDLTDPPEEKKTPSLLRERTRKRTKGFLYGVIAMNQYPHFMKAVLPAAAAVLILAVAIPLTLHRIEPSKVSKIHKEKLKKHYTEESLLLARRLTEKPTVSKTGLAGEDAGPGQPGAPTSRGQTVILQAGYLTSVLLHSKEVHDPILLRISAIFSPYLPREPVETALEDKDLQKLEELLDQLPADLREAFQKGRMLSRLVAIDVTGQFDIRKHGSIVRELKGTNSSIDRYVTALEAGEETGEKRDNVREMVVR